MSGTEESGNSISRRVILKGGIASAALPFIGGMLTVSGIPAAFAQTSGGPQSQKLLEHDGHAHGANFPDSEKRQAEKYTEGGEMGDPNVVVKEGIIHTFYGISRAEVLALPGLHPSPDVYTQFRFRNKWTGGLQSCCDGSDCRPAIIRMLGDGYIAVGVHYKSAEKSIVLFYKLRMDETNIVSTDALTPDNPEYTKHKFHACVYQGRVYCAGFPTEW